MNTSPNSYAVLRNTILTSMLLLPFIPFALVLAIGYSYFTDSLEAGAVSGMARIAEDHRIMIESFLKERRADLAYVAASQRFEDIGNVEALRAVFDRLKEKSEAFADLGVFDHRGVHVAYQGPYQLTGKNYRNAPWFAEVVKGGYYISDVFLGYRRIPHFVIAVTHPSADGLWVLRATIDSRIFDDLVKSVRIGKTGEAYILNRQGALQTERRSGGRLMETVAQSRRFLSIPREGIHTFVDADEADGEFLYAATWLEGGRWLLVFARKKRMLSKPCERPLP